MARPSLRQSVVERQHRMTAVESEPAADDLATTEPASLRLVADDLVLALESAAAQGWLALVVECVVECIVVEGKRHMHLTPYLDLYSRVM